jgi:hypothetical protein
VDVDDTPTLADRGAGVSPMRDFVDFSNIQACIPSFEPVDQRFRSKQLENIKNLREQTLVNNHKMEMNSSLKQSDLMVLL